MKEISGFTKSERYLHLLANKSFLSPWCYPNVFRDEFVTLNGPGKEICDLLVVSGKDILIFSDKDNSWPSAGNTDISWKRWYKRAIRKSLNQVNGAISWIRNHPDRIFFDEYCKEKIDIKLPEPELINIHGIIIAKGSGKACAEFFGLKGKKGLILDTRLADNDHISDIDLKPFRVGDINKKSHFIHVFDELGLSKVMSEFDTISDFTNYLTNRANLLRQPFSVEIDSEEELIARFLVEGFKSIKRSFDDFIEYCNSKNSTHVYFDEKIYTAINSSKFYKNQKKKSRDSYFWDRLITGVINQYNVFPLNGKSKNVLLDVKSSIQHMSYQSRIRRSIYGFSVRKINEKKLHRGSAVCLLFPTVDDLEQETAFVYLRVPFISPHTDKERFVGSCQYRMGVLINYCLSNMERNRHIKRVVGICTDGPDKNGTYIGRTFDTFYYESDDWSNDMINATKELEIKGKKLGFNTNINVEDMKIAHFDNMTDNPARTYHYRKLLNRMRND